MFLDSVSGHSVLWHVNHHSLLGGRCIAGSAVADLERALRKTALVFSISSVSSCFAFLCTSSMFSSSVRVLLAGLFPRTLGLRLGMYSENKACSLCVILRFRVLTINIVLGKVPPVV